MNCPFCHEQGEIIKARIKKLNQVIYICDECELIWFKLPPIFPGNTLGYSEYMALLGLPDLWDELEILNQADSEENKE